VVPTGFASAEPPYLEPDSAWLACPRAAASLALAAKAQKEGPGMVTFRPRPELGVEAVKRGVEAAWGQLRTMWQRAAIRDLEPLQRLAMLRRVAACFSVQVKAVALDTGANVSEKNMQELASKTLTEDQEDEVLDPPKQPELVIEHMDRGAKRGIEVLVACQEAQACLALWPWAKPSRRLRVQLPDAPSRCGRVTVDKTKQACVVDLGARVPALESSVLCAVKALDSQSRRIAARAPPNSRSAWNWGNVEVRLPDRPRMLLVGRVEASFVRSPPLEVSAYDSGRGLYLVARLDRASKQAGDEDRLQAAEAKRQGEVDAAKARQDRRLQAMEHNRAAAAAAAALTFAGALGAPGSNGAVLAPASRPEEPREGGRHRVGPESNSLSMEDDMSSLGTGPLEGCEGQGFEGPVLQERMEEVSRRWVPLAELSGWDSREPLVMSERELSRLLLGCSERGQLSGLRSGMSKDEFGGLVDSKAWVVASFEGGPGSGTDGAQQGPHDAMGLAAWVGPLTGHTALGVVERVYSDGTVDVRGQSTRELHRHVGQEDIWRVLRPDKQLKVQANPNGTAHHPLVRSTHVDLAKIEADGSRSHVGRGEESRGEVAGHPSALMPGEVVEVLTRRALAINSTTVRSLHYYRGKDEVESLATEEFGFVRRRPFRRGGGQLQGKSAYLDDESSVASVSTKNSMMSFDSVDAGDEDLLGFATAESKSRQRLRAMRGEIDDLELDTSLAQKKKHATDEDKMKRAEEKRRALVKSLTSEGDKLFQAAERLGAPALLPDADPRRRNAEQRRQYKAAVDNYRTAMRRSSVIDPQLFGKMARTLVRLHAWDTGLLQCNKALAHFPHSSRLWFYTGLCHLGQRQPAKAAPAFKKSLEYSVDRAVDQHLVSNYFRLACMEAKSEKPQDYIGEFEVESKDERQRLKDSKLNVYNLFDSIPDLTHDTRVPRLGNPQCMVNPVSVRVIKGQGKRRPRPRRPRPQTLHPIAPGTAVGNGEEAEHKQDPAKIKDLGDTFGSPLDLEAGGPRKAELLQEERTPDSHVLEEPSWYEWASDDEEQASGIDLEDGQGQITVFDIEVEGETLRIDLTDAVEGATDELDAKILHELNKHTQMLSDEKMKLSLAKHLRQYAEVGAARGGH